MSILEVIGAFALFFIIVFAIAMTFGGTFTVEYDGKKKVLIGKEEDAK